MASHPKKLEKHCSEHLQADEQFQGALFARPAGSVARSVAFGTAGVIGAAVSDRAARKRQDGHEGPPRAASPPGSPPATWRWGSPTGGCWSSSTAR